MNQDRIIFLKVVSIALIGVIAGLLSGMLGVGGGSILVPAMVFLLGMTQHKAHGTSLAAISIMVFFSALFYSKHGQMDWGVAAELAAGGVIGAMIGARIASALSAAHLKRYFGLFLMVVGIGMVVQAYLTYSAHGLLVTSGQSTVHHASTLLILFTGVLTGIMSGLLGVGGGIIMIPALVFFLGLSQRLAQGISLAVIIPVSISGAFMHSRRGNVSMGIALWLGVGGVIGGLIGANFAVGQSDVLLGGLFGSLMLIMGGMMARPRPNNIS